MITAVIQSGKNTLITDLPRPISDLQNKILSIGVITPPSEIRLFGGEDAAVDVQLASSDRVSQHLCRLFCEHNTLAYVNTTAFLVQTADESFRNLMAIASRTLGESGMEAEAKEMRARIHSADSYYQALGIIGEYVNITSVDDGMDDSDFDEDSSPEEEETNEMIVGGM